MTNYLYRATLIISALCFFLSATSLPTCSQDITSGLEGYWNFDEYDGGDAVDVSDNGRDAFINAGQPIAAAGIKGNAVYLDGTSDFLTPWEGVQGNDPRTIVLWVKTTDVGNGLVGWGETGTATKWHLRINNDASQPDESVVGSVRTEYQGSQTIGTKNVDDGEWHMVASVFEGQYPTDVIHYVDGEMDPTKYIVDETLEIDTVTNTEEENVTIGSRNQGGTFDRIVGTLDEVRIYSRALSEEDIKALYEEATEVDQVVAQRSFSHEFVGPGQSIEVTIEIPEGVAATLIEELPAGWTASDVSHDGTVEGGEIVWELTPEVTSVSYTATVSEGADDLFHGTLDGIITGGEVQILVLGGEVGEFDFHADIGNTGVEGDASFSNGEYSVLGGGADVWGTADGFHFLFSEMTGPFVIKGNAFLHQFDSDSDWVKGGLMVRNNLTPGSSYAFNLIRTDLQLATQARESQGISAFTVQDLTDDQFGDMEIERSGNTINFYYLNIDGERLPAGSVDLEDLEDPVYVGLACTSHSPGNLSELLFSDLEIELIPFEAKRSWVVTDDEEIEPGSQVTVTVDLFARETQDIETLETPPAGWEVSSIQASHGEAALSGDSIEWTIEEHQGSATLTYDITVGSDVWIGTLSGTANGNPIEGMTQIPVPLGERAEFEALAWWRFEEGSAGDTASTIRDYGADGPSEGEFGGQAQNNPVYVSVDEDLQTISGLENHLALQFNGLDQEITGIDALPVGPGSVFTVEAIIRWAGPTGNTNVLLQQEDGIGIGRSWLTVQDSGLMQAYIGGTATQVGGTAVPIDEWVYVGVTYDKGVLVTWMDNDLSDGIDPGTYSNFNLVEMETNDGGLIIGNHKSFTDFFNGEIAELRITTAGLKNVSPEMLEDRLSLIGEDAEASEPAAETYAWWRFEEGIEGEVPDQIQDFGADGASSGDMVADVFGNPEFTSVESPRLLNPGKVEDAMAIHMNGTDTEFFTPPVVLDENSTFTCEAIFTWEGDPGAGVAIFQQFDGIGDGRTWLYLTSEGNLSSYVGGGPTTITDITVPVDQWCYGAVSYDEGQVIVWLDTDLSDGIQPTSHFATTFRTFEENDADFVIGNHKAQENRIWNGLIAELRFTQGSVLNWAESPNSYFQVGEAVPVQDWSLY